MVFIDYLRLEVRNNNKSSAYTGKLYAIISYFNISF